MILNNKFSRHLLLLLILAAIGWGTGTQAAEGLFPNATVMAPPPQPTQMPAFDFANLQGGALKSSEMKGKVIIIRFWATWWDICRGEMPSVQKAHQTYPAKDVVVMTISLDGGDGRDVQKFLDQHRYTMPSAHDKGMAYGRRIGARGVPSTYIIDRDHNIVARGMGPLDLERADIRKLIQTLVAK